MAENRPTAASNTWMSLRMLAIEKPNSSKAKTPKTANSLCMIIP